MTLRNIRVELQKLRCFEHNYYSSLLSIEYITLLKGKGNVGYSTLCKVLTTYLIGNIIKL